jgi:hypothetical protein
MTVRDEKQSGVMSRVSNTVIWNFIIGILRIENKVFSQNSPLGDRSLHLPHAKPYKINIRII